MQIIRLYHTLRYLKWQQVYYRLYYPLKRRFYRSRVVPQKALDAASHFEAVPVPFFSIAHLYTPDQNTFRFLNLEHTFGNVIDWDFPSYGKLWTYNLNYFEWLQDETIPVADRLRTILDFIQTPETGKQNASESYPVSLRVINWVLFLSKYKIKDTAIQQQLHSDLQRLSAFREYHLLGNHLLENAYGLFFGAYYFNEEKWYRQATDLLTSQLNEQILPDGGHYETSPMYHCLLLYRLMLCVALAENNHRFENEQLNLFMRKKAAAMLGWLNAFSFSDGSLAMMGDAAPGIAPDAPFLLQLAGTLNITATETVLKESGYRRVSSSNWELLIDAGAIQPTYQPGHAHADTFSFCLNVDGKPVVVDTGISTYENNADRASERSTIAHNTLSVNRTSSSDVWNSFRTGRRANVNYIWEKENNFAAVHNGFKNFGILHLRSFEWRSGRIIIEDQVDHLTNKTIYTSIHFSPDVVVEQIDENVFQVDKIYFRMNGLKTLHLENYFFCNGFNNKKLAKKLVGVIVDHRPTIVIEFN